MSLEETLVNMLDPIFSNRFYRAELPQDAQLPAGTYQRISTTRGYTHGGDDHLPSIRMQVDCWGADPDSADDVAAAVTLATSGYSDDEFQMIEVLDDSAFHEPSVPIYRRSIDLRISYAEDIGS